MNETQFEHLINGISLLAAEIHISNVIADYAAMVEKPSKGYTAFDTAYALADKFQKKIKNWDETKKEPDFEKWYELTFINPEPPTS